jgi:hypothetical protein
MTAPCGGGVQMDLIEKIVRKLREKNLKVSEKHIIKITEVFIRGYPNMPLEKRIKEFEEKGYRVEFGYKDIAHEGLLYMLGDINIAVIPIGKENVSAIEKIDENNKMVIYEPVDYGEALLLFAENVDKVRDVYYAIKMMGLEEKYAEIIASWYPKKMQEKVKKDIMTGKWKEGPIEVYQISKTDVYVYVPSKERGFIYDLENDVYYEPKEYKEISIECSICKEKLSIKLPKNVDLDLKSFKVWYEISVKRKNPFIKITIETDSETTIYLCSKCIMEKFPALRFYNLLF